MGGKSGFLATAVLGGALYWLWQKARQPSGVPHGREITRWEDEGGAVHGGSSEVTGASRGQAARMGGSGAAQPAHSGGSTPDAWLFPRS